MGFKDSLDRASVVEKVAFCLLFVANFFSWMAFTTNEWADFELAGVTNTYYGVWRVCLSSTGLCSQLDGTPIDWYAAFQAMSVFGFVLTNVSFVLVILYLFKNNCKGDKEVAMATAITGILAGVMWLIAVIIFGIKYDDLTDNDMNLGYSFGLGVVGLTFAAIGGAVMFASQGSSTSPSGVLEVQAGK